MLIHELVIMIRKLQKHLISVWTNKTLMRQETSNDNWSLVATWIQMSMMSGCLERCGVPPVGGAIA